MRFRNRSAFLRVAFLPFASCLLTNATIAPLLEEIFKKLGSRTVLAHAKDVKGGADGTDLPAAGLGALDYPLYLRLLAGLGREMHLALEHLGLEDVPRARDFVRGQLEKV